MQITPLYRGRFAPTPSGPLHFGSLIAALGSYLQARSQAGEWLVRIEDIDPPREVAGAAAAILKTLEKLGFEWDGEVCYQSQRSAAYLDALDTLHRDGALYACVCSRREISECAKPGRYGPIYSGQCRQRHNNPARAHSLRVLTHDQSIGFDDRLLGRFEQRLESEVGDFVVRRADGLFAYQLAVVVDDAEQGVSEVVRGADLFDNTPRQIHLQQLLHLPTPAYVHLPLALNRTGQKLSKQNLANSIHEARPQQVLLEALRFLHQQPPAELLDCDLESLWRWAVDNWNLAQVPRQNQLAPSTAL